MWIDRLLTLIRNFLMKPDLSFSGSLYLMAISKLGKDASPQDRASDEYGCVESVTEIIHAMLPEVPVMLGTYTFWEYMQRSQRFQETLYPERGCIVISPTGTSSKKAKNGHVGIMGDNEIIMSSDSRSGLFLENYALKSWKLYYKDKLGFPVFFYKLV